MRLPNTFSSEYSDQLVLSEIKKCVNKDASLEDIEILKKQIGVENLKDVCYKKVDIEIIKKTFDIIKEKNGDSSEEYEQLQKTTNE